MQLWPLVSHLFETDDGSLPDIYVENLSDEQLVSVSEWLVSKGKTSPDQVVWNIEKQADQPIHEIPFPTREFIAGKIESFRIWIEDISFHGVTLPTLSLEVTPGCISLDYRMGQCWNEQRVEALFGILRAIRRDSPRATFLQADEGCYDRPNLEFSEAFDLYCAQ